MGDPMSFNDQLYYRVGDAAKELNTSPATIRRWHDNGHLDGFVHPVNSYRFVTKDSVDDLMGKMGNLGIVQYGLKDPV